MRLSPAARLVSAPKPRARAPPHRNSSIHGATFTSATRHEPLATHQSTDDNRAGEAAQHGGDGRRGEHQRQRSPLLQVDVPRCELTQGVPVLNKERAYGAACSVYSQQYGSPDRSNKSY